MSPRVVPAIKGKIRQLDLGEARDAAEKCLDMSTAGEVERYLDSRFGALVAT